MAADLHSHERFWQSAVARLSRRIHLGWWLDAFLARLIPLALLGAVAVLFARWRWEIDTRPALAILGAGVALAALAALIGTRRRREPRAATQVRLEDALGLKTRLTAAAAGIGPWPRPLPDLLLPVAWRAGRPAGMALICVALLAAAFWVPITRHVAEAPRVIEPPSALREVQDWIDNVKKQEAVSEDSVNEIEEKVAELLQRPAQNWYEHASLEAAEHLRDITAQDLQQLTQNLADAERAASALAASAAGAGLPQAAKDALSNLLQNASQSMQTAGMQPSADLLDALKNLDPSQLSSMSSEQMRDLANQLAQNQQALQEALKNSPKLDLSGIPKGVCKQCGKSPGECQCQGDGEEEGPGRGGISRGPGTAPLTFDDQDTQLDTQRVETLASRLDTQRLATGDALSVTDGATKVDPSAYQGPQQGGAVSSPGDGGNAVWQNTLLPAERETLKRFFK